MKKQVNIKCIANKYLNECNYYVFVYLSNKVIFQGYLNSSKILNLKLLPCKYYKIIILGNTYLLPQKYIADVFVNNDDIQNYIFFFDLKKILTSINVKVTDKYYKSLPIEKGELKLSQQYMKSH